MNFLRLGLGCTNTLKENFFKDFSNILLKFKNLENFHFELSNAYFISEETFEALGYSLKTLDKIRNLTLSMPLVRAGWTFLRSLCPIKELNVLKLDFFRGKITDASLRAFSGSPFLKNL